jgi:DNA-binding response OmpR family regulator
MQLGVLRIVVVEDNYSMSQAIERVLRAGGFSPILFDSAEDALEAGIASLADCLVLDITLPGMSGFDLYEELILRGDIPPAIFITAHDDASFRERAARLGASSYHPKPFFGRTLLAAVNQALQTH